MASNLRRIYLNRKAIILVAAATFCGLLPGCGPALVKVSGRLTEGGKLVTLNKGETLSVGLYAMDDPGEFPRAYAADLEKDGSFTVPGPRRTGIPPGRYKIAVQIVNRWDKDRLNEAFNPQNTTIVRDVKGKETTLQIDLDHPKDE